jgi:Domain of unknown function (DUF4258)
MKRKSDTYLQDAQLKNEILKHIKEDKYRLTKHAEVELKNDDFDLNDVLHVLKTGKHNHKKTGFDTRQQTWKYAFEGMTKDLKKARVIIAFDCEMLIITVMEL